MEEVEEDILVAEGVDTIQQHHGNMEEVVVVMEMEVLYTQIIKILDLVEVDMEEHIILVEVKVFA